MAHYAYKAMDANGQLSRGWLEAADLGELDRRLRDLGLQLIRARHNPLSFLRPKVKRSELITFFLTLEQLSRAGVPLLDALGGLRDSVDGPLRLVVADVLEGVTNGKPLSQALARHTTTFDPVCISLIHAGEESGRLPEVFRQLADTLKWQDELSAHTRNLLLYPTFVAIIVGAITLFLLIWLVPQLASVIQSFGQTLPLQTRLLLTASEWLRQFWFVPPITLVVLVVLLRFQWSRHADWHVRLDAMKLRLWLLGGILRKIILARFANTFALLYAAGISVLDCLALCRDLAGNRVIANGLKRIADEVESGQTLTQSFQHTGLFPPLVLQMLKVGEATGNLDQALLNVSYFYGREVHDSIRRLQTLLEPALTVFLGLILGWVMLAMLLPIYDIISQVNIR
ncbi:Putative type II secretion system protein F [Ferriphaselus amnicola]|uniref:Type II secretion system protein F n=1 Tax=Ferriphaselus amnicola TaxID=1188319 RepID=A0A2Z6G981_9PROT|nr:type II secretion system F family protein [Ferriphaselus amnicola]BBE50027.1 Putative type II secretion system protein F [Ferriphaselus amnicola]